MGELDGRVAIVTGSSSGIGEATARRLADLGCQRRGQLVVVRRSGRRRWPSRCRRRPCTCRRTSATKPKGKALIARTIEHFGRLDILVNNAGWTTRVDHADLDALTDEILRRTFEVNVFGTWWLTKAAMPHLRQSPDPNVVMITSIAGLRPVGSSIAYAMSKAALNHLTALLAKSCGPVRVNAVAPGTRRNAVDRRLEGAARRRRRRPRPCADRPVRRTAPRP